MNVHKLFPSKYVTAIDLNGKDVRACIQSLTMERMKKQSGGEESKPVVRFKGGKKGMVLNKTNAMTIAGLYGPETDEWIGKCVTLYATEVSAFGKMQRAIRIRPEMPPEEPSGPSIAEVVTEPPPEDTGPDLDDYGLDEVIQGEEVAFG